MNSRFFKDSKIIKLLSHISHPRLSIIFLSLSLSCFWYESWFSSIGVSSVSSLNLATVFLIFSLLFCDKSRLKSTKQILYLLAFAICLLLSGLIASIRGLQMGMIFVGIILFCQFIFAFVITSTYKNKRLVINMALTLTTPLLFVGLYQLIWGGETSNLWVSTAETLINRRIFGFFGSPNVFGGVLMLGSIMSLFELLRSKKWYFGTYLLISLVLIIFTFSRSAWLGLIFGVVTALIIKNWRYIFIFPASLLLFISPAIRQRFLTVFSQNYVVDASLDGRIWATNNAIEIYKTSPILGVGPGAYGGQTAVLYDSPVYLDGMQNGYVALAYTDNQWMQILAQIGVFGFLALAGFFISHLVNNLRQYRQTRDYLALGIIASTIAILINGAFANIFEFGAVSVLAGTYLGLGNSYGKN